MADLPPLVKDPTDTLAVLKAARKWLDDPAHWCRDNAMEDAHGNATGDPRSTCRTCAIGAYRLVVGGAPAEHAYAALTNRRHLFYLTDVNERGHAAVLELYDRAIERLEGSVAA